MKKLIVYTVLTGDDSQLNNPFDESWVGFDRVCLTDDLSLSSDIWQIKPVQNLSIDPHRLSRHPKILTHEYFPDHEWSLYLDNTVRLTKNPMEILEEYADKGSPWWSFRYPWRNCIYDEAEEVIKYDLDLALIVRNQMDFYKANGYPQHQGLNANTFLLRKHNDAAVISFSKLWFFHVLLFSRRDQLSFNYVADLVNLNHAELFGELTDNELMQWPGYDNLERLPRNFDPSFYLWMNPDVKLAGIKPQVHYSQWGKMEGRVYSRKSWELDKLSNKYRTDKGSMYFNAHGYSFHYERYFSDLKKESIRILEIGLLQHDVQSLEQRKEFNDAPSLCVWRDYFPNAEIIGFDIADFSDVPLRANMQIIQGDMANKNDIEKLKMLSPFDIIIDGASHASHHQQFAFKELFGALNPGGYYVIEDLNYQPPALESSGAVKTLTFLHNLASGRALPTQSISRETIDDLYSNIEFIHFHDSFEKFISYPPMDNIAFIKKSSMIQKHHINLPTINEERSRLQVNQELNQELNEIYKSKSWKLVMVVRAISIRLRSIFTRPTQR